MASAILSLAAAGVLFSSTIAAAPAAQCSGYAVNTTNNVYKFNHYEFLDFRNADSSFLSSSAFTSQYRPQTWGNGKFQNLANNVAITSDTVDGAKSGMLSLYARQNGGQATAAELDSTSSDYYYASVRMGVRVTGAPGACAGLFFYHSDTQETDIEILTREQQVHLDAETMQSSPATTSQLHFTNQPRLTKTVDITPNTLFSATGNSKLGNQPTTSGSGSWEDFNTYRIDWIPGVTEWWQNGIMSHTANKNLITTPSSWILNIWSNGDPSWSGAMAPNTEARMDILWVEMAYNKEAEGPPQTVAAGKQGCTLSAGDGTNLADPGSTTTKQAVQSSTTSSVEEETTYVAKRSAKFVA